MAAATKGSGRPEITKEEASQISLQLFGLDVQECRELGSYDDRNFFVCGTLSGNTFAERFVLKIHNFGDSSRPDFVMAQNLAMLHVHSMCECNVPIPGVDGSLSSIVKLPFGSTGASEYIVRLLSYLDGQLLLTSPQCPALHISFGRLLGAVDQSLSTFSHPGLSRSHDWDLTTCHLTFRRLLSCITDSSSRAVLESIAELFEERVFIQQSHLRRQAIHGDANSGNILVDAANPTQVSGIIDFGDLCEGWLVADVSIALMYLMGNCVSSDPFRAASSMMEGYLSVFPLLDVELKCIPTLIKARIGQSLSIASYAVSLDPANATYILSDFDNNRKLLKLLMALSDEDILRKILPAAHQGCVVSN